MAWIREVPPSTRHPYRRWQVCYRDQEGVERSGGIYTKGLAETWKRRIEKGKLPPHVRTRKPRNADVTQAGDDTQPATLETFGDFVTGWWPTWAALHPASAARDKLTLNARILPTFGDLELPYDNGTALAAWTKAIGAWKAELMAEGLRAHSINDYLGLLSRIINAAVDVELFDRNPMQRRSGNQRVPMLRNLEVEPVDIWLTMQQLDRLAEAIDDRYRAMVILGGRAGLRFGECAGLLWVSLGLDDPYDDGSVAGVGRLTILEAVSDPARNGKSIRKPPKSRAGRRTIALDSETVDALKLHSKHYGDDPAGQVFTSPGGNSGPGGTLVARNFSRVWHRALRKSGLDAEFGYKTVTKRVKRDGETVSRQVQTPRLTFHGLRHTHATHLIALGRPPNYVAARLGHKSPAFTMEIYASVISRAEAGNLRPNDLGLQADDDA